MRIRPLLGDRRPSSTLANVERPEPDRPTMATRSPACSRKDRSDNPDHSDPSVVATPLNSTSAPRLAATRGGCTGPVGVAELTNRPEGGETMSDRGVSAGPVTASRSARPMRTAQPGATSVSATDARIGEAFQRSMQTDPRPQTQKPTWPPAPIGNSHAVGLSNCAACTETQLTWESAEC